jgi:3-vinyl bacteriochlorophyllide hydratase
MPKLSASTGKKNQLYTVEQKLRRDQTHWTTVQGILAPVQFLVFIVSVLLVSWFLISGEGYKIATISVVVKTLILYTIMITGAIWEKVVFDRYLLAAAFFWEDVVSFFVIALHSLYLFVLVTNYVDDKTKMWIAIIAYFAYVVNAIQFIIKFRMARNSSNAEAEPDDGVLI